MRDFVADAPDELGLMANLRLAPPLPLFPPEVQGTPIIALVVTWSGDVEAGERFLRPLRTFGTPVADAITTKAYTAHQKMLDAAVPARAALLLEVAPARPAHRRGHRRHLHPPGDASAHR